MHCLARLGLALAILLSACGNDDAAPAGPQVVAVDISGDLGSKPSGSFLTAYDALRANPAPAAPSLDLSGPWTGYLLCRTSVHAVTLDITGKTGAITIDEDVTRPGRAAFYQSVYKDTPTDITRRDGAGLAQFRADLSGRQLVGRVLLTPGAPDRALLSVQEYRNGRLYYSCQTGLLARDDERAKLDNQLQMVKALAARSEPVLQGACPPALEAVREKALALPRLSGGRIDLYAMVGTPELKAALGGPYAGASAEVLRLFTRDFTGKCLPRGRTPQVRADRVALVQFASNIARYETWEAVVMASQRVDLLSAWTQWIAGELDRGAPLDGEDLLALYAANRSFDFKSQGLSEQFIPAVRARIEARQDGARERQLVARLERARDDFTQLIAIAMQAEQRGDMDVTVPALALDHYLVSAAEATAFAAAEEQDIGTGLVMLNWIESQRRAPGTCLAKTPDVCQAAANAMVEPLRTLAAQLAASEADAAKQALSQDEDLKGLAALTAYSSALQQRFGSLLDVGQLAALSDQLRNERQALQADVADDLKEAIEAVGTTAALTQLCQRYFLPGDLDVDAIQPVQRALVAARQGKAPFTGLAHADYFNGLYNQEFKTLAALDQEALAGLRPLLALGGQQMALYGDLIDSLAGRERGTSAARTQAAMRNLSVLPAIIGTYLIEYQDRYGACLGADAVTYTITTRREYVTRNGLGTVIKRSPGWTTRDSYRIPARFREQFQDLFGTATENEFGQLLDVFLNNGTVLRIRSATRRLMDKNQCDSAEIKQFERGLLAYDADLSRRLKR